MASFRSPGVDRSCPMSDERLFPFGFLLDSVTTVFLAVAFAGERRFQTALFAGRNIEGVPFDFTDNVFLLHFAFEAAERAFQRLGIAQFDFCH